MYSSNMLLAALKTVLGTYGGAPRVIRLVARQSHPVQILRHSSSKRFGGDYDGFDQRDEHRLFDDDFFDDMEDSSFPKKSGSYGHQRSRFNDFNGFRDDVSSYGHRQHRPKRKPQYKYSGPAAPKRFSRFREDYDEDDDFDFYRNDFSGRRTYGKRLGSQLKEHDWTTTQMEAVEKNFYVEDPDVQNLSQEEVTSFYKEHDITVPQGEKVKPILDFKQANFSDPINKYVKGLSWSSPTPIQSMGWPIALSGKNMVGIAQTGSGKTLGFVMPALVHAKHQRQVGRGEGPVVLVLAPTRELAQQIKAVCSEFGRVVGVRSAAIFGGQSKFHQSRRLAEGPEIVIATPGRLLDMLETEMTSLERTTYLVLDEADRMLDMGFEPQIRKILSQIRPDRQILLWSATWPREVQDLARDFLGREFTQVNIGSTELVANPNIQQDVIVCERQDKFFKLVEALEKERSSKTLVFTQTKKHADRLAQFLKSRHRFRVMALHGDKSQTARDTAMKMFKDGIIDVVVATDVASRGLDVNDIELVVNFDYPNTADDYIHRIGRTARAHKTGRSLTFVTEDDADQAKNLISILTNAGQPVPEDLKDLAFQFARFNKRSGKGFKPKFDRDPRRW